MKKFIFSLGLAAAFTFSYGIVQGAPAGSEFHLEQNNETLAAQQQYQGRIESSREVPMNTNPTEAKPIYSTAERAQQTVAIQEQRDQARANLKKADTQIKKEEEPANKSYIWIVFVMLAAAVVSIGYYYADKLTPNAPEKKFKRKSKLS